MCHGYDDGRSRARRRHHPLRAMPRLFLRALVAVRPRRRIEALGGWRFGNTINGAQAEYLLVPYAQANLAKIPDDLTDEQVVLCGHRFDRLQRRGVRRTSRLAIRWSFSRRDQSGCAQRRAQSSWARRSSSVSIAIRCA